MIGPEGRGSAAGGWVLIKRSVWAAVDQLWRFTRRIGHAPHCGSYLLDLSEQFADGCHHRFALVAPSDTSMCVKRFWRSSFVGAARSWIAR